MLLSLLSLALAAPAPAPACDAKALGKALEEASPQGAAAAFVALAECNAAAGKAAAPVAFPRILPGPGGDAAAIAAMKVGAGDAVRTWIASLQPDERGSTLDRLGETCTDAAVPAFFIESYKALGEKFWSGRWHAALDTCRAPVVQELLRGELGPLKKDRALFGAVLDVYARNLGAAAIPTVQELARGETDPLVLIDLVDALPDAAGVGAPNGANPEAVTQALAALEGIAPTLPEKSADHARTVYLALGDERGADKLVTVRYASSLQADGGLIYGVVAVEKATCKKGDVRVEAHHAELRDPGKTWPDQVKERVGDSVKAGFEMDLAASCKGTGTVELFTPEAPLKDAAAYKAWLDATLTEVGKASPGVSVKVFPHEPIKL